MKRILLPAVATLVMAASTAAYAQSGPWFVVFNDQSRTCTAQHGVGASTGGSSMGSQEQTVSGPFDSQESALVAINGIGVCGGSGMGDGLSGTY